MLRYRDFPFPLNVLLNVLTREEGRAENMHYGLFEAAGDSIATAQERFGDRIRVHTTALEAFEPRGRFDIVLFQESSQYIECETLFRKVRGLAAPHTTILVLDEFALEPIDRPQSLPRLDHFLAAAAAAGFRLQEVLDLSDAAAPTVDYFLARIPKHREAIESELAVGAAEIDGLLESGAAYRELYRSGAYGYRLLRFRGPGEIAS